MKEHKKSKNRGLSEKRGSEKSTSESPFFICGDAKQG